MTVDLLSGFWQTPMEESSKQNTSLTVETLEFFQCEHMLFGLCNAPAIFQQLMTSCLVELNYLTCLVYLDDVIFIQAHKRNTSKACKQSLKAPWTKTQAFEV